MKVLTTILFVTLLLAGESTTAVGGWDASGFIGIEGRYYGQEANHPEQEDGLASSLILQPELRWRSDDGRNRVSIVGIGRADTQDSERSHLDLREAYWATEGDDWDLTIGINKVFWGVAEARHLVDVINQTDLVEDIDQEDKLGQPMVNLNLQRNWGRLELFLLPWFRERTFPGVEGRLRAPLPVKDNKPRYESAAGEKHWDLAARYSHYFGDVDVGLYLFHGTSREPHFTLADDGERLYPVYEQMTQLGLDLQYTRDAWLWKFEGIVRNTDTDAFSAAVAGFEYTLYGVHESAVDVGVLMEFLYDGRNDAAPPTVFDRDLFLGTRIALNDVSDTAVLAGAVVDTDSGERLLNVEAERRFGDRLSVELRLRAFANADDRQGIRSFEQDDYLQVKLHWYY